MGDKDTKPTPAKYKHTTTTLKEFPFSCHYEELPAEGKPNPDSRKKGAPSNIPGLPPREPGTNLPGHKREVHLVYGCGPIKDYDRTALFKTMPAGNPKTGEKSTVSAAVPTHAATVMQKIIQARLFPELQTMSDFVRWAITRALDTLLAIDGQVAGMAQGMVGIDQMLAEDRKYADWIESQLGTLKELVLLHNAANRPEFGMRILYQFAQQVQEMPIGPWKGEYLRKLEDQFGPEIRKATKDAKVLAKAEDRKKRKVLKFRPVAPGEEMDWGPDTFQVLNELGEWEAYMPKGFVGKKREK